MRKYNIDVNINGKITFEVEAENKNKAIEMVNDMLNNSKFKELAKKGNFNLNFKEKNKDKER